MKITFDTVMIFARIIACGALGVLLLLYIFTDWHIGKESLIITSLLAIVSFLPLILKKITK